MTHQRLQNHSKDSQYQEIEMSFPVITPFSYLPMVKLLSVKRWLQRYFFDMHKWQQPSEIVREKVIESRIVHPSQSIQISLSNIFLHWTSYANYSGMPSIVLFNHAHEGFHCWFCWGFQLNIHRHVGKSLEYLFQSWHFFVVASDSMAFPCEIESNLFLERWQFIIIEITNMFWNSACSTEIFIMMYNQNAIFSLTYIHLQHIAMLLDSFKCLYRVLGGMPRTTTMGHPQKCRAVECLLKALDLMLVPLV